MQTSLALPLLAAEAALAAEVALVADPALASDPAMGESVTAVGVTVDDALGCDGLGIPGVGLTARMVWTGLTSPAWYSCNGRASWGANVGLV